jgi:glycosyltransferase involved in cell wall biosynthesis
VIVCHVVAPAPFGGLESVVQSLALARLKAGQPVSVAALLQDQVRHPFVERLRADGIPVAEIKTGRRHYLAEVRQLTGLLQSGQVTLVHAHNYHADYVGYLAARRCAVPVVTTVHGFSGGDWKARLYEILDRRLMRSFDAVICVSEHTADIVRGSGVPERRIAVIPNAYQGRPVLPRGEARRRLALPGDQRVVGWVGRLSFEKGPDLLVEAVARLGLDDVVTVLVGDGPERDRVEGLRSRLALAPDRVRLVGRREDAAALLCAFDAIVISSRREGTPMILLEAIAAGVPVVSFGVGGVPGVVDESSAWLVPERDVDALARAVRHALTDPAEAARRAEAARAVLAERFGVEPWLDRYEAVYREAQAVAAARAR